MNLHGLNPSGLPPQYHYELDTENGPRDIPMNNGQTKAV